MSWGNGNLGGGGGFGGLNFEIVGGAAKPKHPKENTIWVNTNVKIENYSFSATTPSNPVNGTIWIKCSNASNTPINIFKKKNEFIAYPNLGYQFVNGAWINKTVLIYHENEWVAWVTYLYKNGDVFDAITGGWKNNPKAIYPNATAQTPNMSLDNNGIYISQGSIYSQRGNGYCGPVKSIDLTSYSTLNYNVISANINSGYGGNSKNVFGIYKNSVDDKNAVLKGDIQTTGSKTLDISSLKGSYILAIVTYNDEGTVNLRINDIWLGT